jgi:hypothetical protein
MDQQQDPDHRHRPHGQRRRLGSVDVRVTDQSRVPLDDEDGGLRGDLKDAIP